MRKKLAREKVQSRIAGQGNKVFCVTFTKKDGTDRKMVARLGVKKGLKGGENKVVKPDNSYMTVYDMQKQAYRTLNLRTIKNIKLSGVAYDVQ